MKKIALVLGIVTISVFLGILAFGQSSGPIAESTSASKANYMYTASHQFCYDASSTSWRWVNVIDTQADGQATSLNGQVTSSIGYGYNGTTFDMLRVGASNELQTTDVANRPGEDVANDWRKTKKEQIATYTPAGTIGTAVTSVETTILAAIEVVADANFCVYVKNVGGGSADAFTDVAIQTSPNNSDWTADLGWTNCDTAASGVTCVYCVSGNAYRYIKVTATCGAGDDTTASAWYVSNKG